MAPLETRAKKWLQPALDYWPPFSFLESSTTAAAKFPTVPNHTAVPKWFSIKSTAFVPSSTARLNFASWGLRSRCCVRFECLAEEPPSCLKCLSFCSKQPLLLRQNRGCNQRSAPGGGVLVMLHHDTVTAATPVWSIKGLSPALIPTPAQDNVKLCCYSRLTEEKREAEKDRTEYNHKALGEGALGPSFCCYCENLGKVRPTLGLCFPVCVMGRQPNNC